MIQGAAQFRSLRGKFDFSVSQTREEALRQEGARLKDSFYNTLELEF